MKRSITYSIAAGAILFLSACADSGGAEMAIDDYRPTIESDGIDFYSSKYDAKDVNCFYRGSGKIPDKGSKKTDQTELQAELVFIGHEPNTGSFTRFELKDGAKAKTIEDLIIAGSDAAANTAISALNPSDFQPAAAVRLETLAKFNGIPNPFDLSLSWYERIAFVLIEDSETFEPRSPFRVAVGVPGAKSPFRSVNEVSDKLVIVDYVSLPPRTWIKGYETIKNRNCLYYYDLTLLQTFQDKNGTTVQVPITIDPGGEGNGGPPGGGPPEWP